MGIRMKCYFTVGCNGRIDKHDDGLKCNKCGKKGNTAEVIHLSTRKVTEGRDAEPDPSISEMADWLKHIADTEGESKVYLMVIDEDGDLHSTSIGMNCQEVAFTLMVEVQDIIDSCRS